MSEKFWSLFSKDQDDILKFLLYLQPKDIQFYCLKD